MKLVDAMCDTDYCYLIISVPPSVSAAGAIAKIKGYTGRKLLEEFEAFSRTQNLWTRNYLVSTNTINDDAIQQFRNKQVTHY
jgi:putative transposase